MKAYLASQYARRDELRERAKELREAGIEVTSRWLRERQPLTVGLKDVSEAFRRKTARQDVEDVLSADVLIAFSEDPEEKTRRGGRHVEFGIALHAKKRIVVVGPRENIFHFCENVEQFDTWPEALATLKC